MKRLHCKKLALVAAFLPALTVSAFLTEEEAYAQKWSRADFVQTLAESSEWLNNDIGKGRYAPPPWTPMEVSGQKIFCWGRVYRYADSILPVQIVSQDVELLAAPPRFVLWDGDREYRFADASVEVSKVHDGLVEVNSVSSAGPYILALHASYEFDGMAKVTMQLTAPEGDATVERLHLEIPLHGERSILYHWSGGRFGVECCGKQLHPLRPPMSDAGFLPAHGASLDAFREVVWLGDQNAGFTWFADSMKGWEIRDEKEIQQIITEENGARTFRVKLADRRFVLDQPLQIVFGVQATPMRPRPADFRSLHKYDVRWGDDRNIAWHWSWSEGHYYPSQKDHAAAAKEYVLAQRAKGMELMQAGSLQYYGLARFYRNMFGNLTRPGMILREMLLWQDLWENPYREIDFNRYVSTEYAADSPADIQGIKDRSLRDRAAGKIGGRTIEEVLEMPHVAAGEWYGNAYRPNPYPATLCPNSAFQDYYIWQLQQFIAQTSVGAHYLDNGFRTCSHAGHGCGYINPAGKWAGESPIFAMREMLKRIYFTFLEQNGRPPLIKWHQSSQMAIPAMSFIDIHWNGELYAGGVAAAERDISGGRFYSEILDEGAMQVFHSGKPFGFLASLLPVITKDSVLPRTAASERDMLGLMLLHDSHIEAYSDFTNHPELVHGVLRKRLSYPLHNMHVKYYWDKGSGVRVQPAEVKPILHYNQEQALMILFNWGDSMALPAVVNLDTASLGLKARSFKVSDAISGLAVPLLNQSQFQLDLLPRDFRMLEITWAERTLEQEN